MATRIVRLQPSSLVTSPTESHQVTGADLTAETLASAAGKINYIIADNTANGAVTYLKLYDTGSTPDHGTDNADWTFKIPASQKVLIDFPDGISSFASGLHVMAATLPGLAGSAPASSFNPVVGLTLD